MTCTKVRRVLFVADPIKLHLNSFESWPEIFFTLKNQIKNNNQKILDHHILLRHTHISANVECTVFLINFDRDNPSQSSCLLYIGTLSTNGKTHQMIWQSQHVNYTHLFLCSLRSYEKKGSSACFLTEKLSMREWFCFRAIIICSNNNIILKITAYYDSKTIPLVVLPCHPSRTVTTSLFLDFWNGSH